jgi:hypothetical protein
MWLQQQSTDTESFAMAETVLYEEEQNYTLINRGVSYM